MPKDLPNSSAFVPEPDTLVIEDQTLVYGFIQLPKQILWARNLSRDAKMLYAILLGYAWQESRCFPGYARLCQDMGASENFVRKCMRELQETNLLKQKRRGLGLTNIYTLTDLRTARLEIDHSHLNSRTSRHEVQEPHGSRTSWREVQEPPQYAVPEPSWREVKVETVEKEADEKEADISNIRRASTREKREETTEEHGRPQLAPPSLEAIGAVIQRRRGRPSRQEQEARQAIAAYIEDFSRELGDQAPLKSSVTRALNLLEASGLSLEAFINVLYEARSVTKEHTASIRTMAEGGNGRFPTKNKMAYYFAVVEDRLGLRGDDGCEPASAQPATNQDDARQAPVGKLPPPR